MRLAPLCFLALSLASSDVAAAQTVAPGLEGDALVDALVAGYKPSVVLSLEESKDTLYAVVDTAHVGGEVGAVGVYSGQFVALDCDPTCDPSQDVNNDAAGLNQEHVWPRSRGAHCVGSVATCDPRAESDLHHLRAARSSVNSARGNLPFGDSPDALTSAWYRLEVATSTAPATGRDDWSERLGDELFEPRRSEKGDIARAALYAFTMYGPRSTRQADPAFFEQMRATLLDWHDLDPVDDRETARMWRAARYQQDKPNPFVVDATLARRAYGAGTAASGPASGYAPRAWVNEFHYDDAGDDEGEFVEVAVDAAFPNPSELVLTLYNGADGRAYASHSVATFQAGAGAGAARLLTLALPADGLQNGGPDGIALSYSGGAGAVVLDFVCYEGTMTAADGPAAGETCAAVGLEESNATPEGQSLGRTGTAALGDGFSWASGAASPGAANAGQTVETPVHTVVLEGESGWRLIGAPAATSVADLLSSLWTQGSAGSDVPGGPATVYTFTGADGWTPVPDLDVTLAPGQAVSVYVFEDDDARAPGVQGGFPKTLTASGYSAEVPFRFAVPTPAGGPEGAFTLVGNPGGAGLEWNPSWDRADVAATIHVYDPGLPGYRTHNGTSGSLEGGVVPPFTAFWVEADGPAPRLIAPRPNARVARRAVPELALEARAEVDGRTRTAVATVAFDDRARSGRDDLDGCARDPLAPSFVRLASVLEGERLSLDARPLVPGDSLVLEVGAVAGGAGVAARVTLSWPALPDVALSLNGVALEAGGSHTLEVAAGPPGRVVLEVGARPVDDEPGLEAGLAVRLGPTPTPGPSRLWARADGARVSAVVVDALGRVVASAPARPGVLEADLPGGLAAGVYVVRVTAERDGRTERSARLLTVVR